MKLEDTSKKNYLTLEEMIEQIKTNTAYSIRFLDGVFCLINEDEDGEIIGETKNETNHTN